MEILNTYTVSAIPLWIPAVLICVCILAMVMSYVMCYYDDVAAAIGGVAFILALIFALIGGLTNTEYVEATLSDDVAFVDVYRYYEPVSTRGDIITFKVVGQPKEKENDDNSQ